MAKKKSRSTKSSFGKTLTDTGSQSTSLPTLETDSAAVSPFVPAAPEAPKAKAPARTTSSGMPTIGRYVIVRELGQGATSTVYLAEDPENDRNVALKVIMFGEDHTKQSRRLRRLFKGEAAMAKELHHPNIVQIYDAEIDEDMAWIAMEYVEGVPLGKYCTFDSLIPPHRVTGIIFKAAMALDYASRRGIVHRDIKPDNIMLTEDDEVKITDFGLALNLKKKEVSDSTFIMGVGSPAYMSPEQVKDYPLNGQTDLYSLGVVMFEMLTGRRPYRGKNYAALVYKIINMDAPAVSTLNPSVPTQLDPIVKRALEKDLYSRYRTGAQFAQDLSGAKFQILDDSDVEKYNLRFRIVRKLSTFTEFDNDEIWEVLRISSWRVVHESYAVMKEGDPGDSFGIVIDGEVEVSLGGRRLARLTAGDVLGEMAFLSKKEKVRSATVVAITDVVYMEVNPSAFELASEECKEHFEEILIGTINRRLNEANARLIENAPEAVRVKESEFDFELMPMDDANPSAG